MRVECCAKLPFAAKPAGLVWLFHRKGKATRPDWNVWHLSFSIYVSYTN
jgi:hypothetical protein